MFNSRIWIASLLFRRKKHTVISNVYFLCPFFVLDVYQWHYWLAEQQQLWWALWGGNVPPCHSAMFTWAGINWVNAIDFGHLPFSKGEVSGKKEETAAPRCSKEEEKEMCVRAIETDRWCCCTATWPNVISFSPYHRWQHLAQFEQIGRIDTEGAMRWNILVHIPQHVFQHTDWKNVPHCIIGGKLVVN